MAKILYTEAIKFQPTRAWVVLVGDKRQVESVHVEKRQAEKRAITLQLADRDQSVTFTRCAVLPNFVFK